MLRRGPYPWSVKQRIAGPLGHLSNEQGAALLGSLAARGRLRHVVLAHLSENNNLPELALGAARRQLHGMPISLHLASQKGATEPLRVVGPSTQLSLF
jgi:phosphoribosyl 1,2-cyclic phosphodiesterase